MDQITLVDILTSGIVGLALILVASALAGPPHGAVVSAVVGLMVSAVLTIFCWALRYQRSRKDG